MQTVRKIGCLEKLKSKRSNALERLAENVHASKSKDQLFNCCSVVAIEIKLGLINTDILLILNRECTMKVFNYSFQGIPDRSGLQSSAVPDRFMSTFNCCDIFKAINGQKRRTFRNSQYRWTIRDSG